MLEHTIYRTRGEHANHYATDAVLILRNRRNIMMEIARKLISKLYIFVNNLTDFDNRHTCQNIKLLVNMEMPFYYKKYLAIKTANHRSV